MSEPPAVPPGPEQKTRVPAFNAPPLTVWCCGLIAALFIAVKFTSPGAQKWFFQGLAFYPKQFLFALETGDWSLQLIWSLLGYSFLHFDWLHLLVNVGFLLAFGSLIERGFGAWRYVITFVLSAAGGAVVQALTGPGGPMIGASGAVYGLLGAAVPLMYNRRRGGISSGLSFIAVLMGINVLIAWLNGDGDLFGAPIAWQAHIGGFFTGLILGLLFMATRHRGRPG